MKTTWQKSKSSDLLIDCLFLNFRAKIATNSRHNTDIKREYVSFQSESPEDMSRTGGPTEDFESAKIVS